MKFFVSFVRPMMIGILGFGAVLFALAPAWADGHGKKTVAVTQIVEHPALDAVRDGILEVLEKNGYRRGDNLTFVSESAQGSPATAAQIARRFAGMNADVVVGISTPSAQALAAVVKNTPVVFSAVTDPLAAKLVNNLEAPGGNITGVSDLSPIPRHLDLIMRHLPEISRLGVIYNPGEVNSVALVERIRKDGARRNWTIVESGTPNSAGVLAAARGLVGKVDAFYIPTDNTVVSAFEAVVKVSQEADIPLFAGDTDSVKRGAAAAIGFDYRDVGLQTGEMIVKILKGADPGSLPVEYVSELQIHVNPAAAMKSGLMIPQDLLDKAVIIE